LSFTFHIHSIKFQESRYDQNSNLEIMPGNVTILVGPSNGGKSEVLRDIEKFCFSNKPDLKLISEISFTIPKEDNEIEELLTKFSREPPQGVFIEVNHVYLNAPNLMEHGRPLETTIDKVEYKWRLKQGKISGVQPEITKFFTVRLDGHTRFDLVLPRNIGNLARPENFLVSLLRRDKEREKVRDKTFSEFGLYCYLDTTEGTIQIKFSPKKISSELERSSSEKAINFFKKNAIKISDLGDGIQAFTGLLLAVYSLDQRILLIDEPEAFLHPPQANHLGRHLAELANERSGSLIASTHNADFLLGCLEQVPKTTILRLTYDGNKGTIKLLSSNDILEFMKDPLLRSTNTLTALFHKSAIVTESDDDRVFYREVNHILEPKKLNIDDAVFLNGHGKSSIHKIAGPLRKIGIPAACIYDLDVIDFTSNHWKDVLNRMNVPETEFEKLDNERQFIFNELTKLQKDNEPNPMKKCGLSALKGKSSKRAKSFIETLDKYGIFLVEVGELEQWLKSFGIGGGNENKWFVEMMQKLDQQEIDSIDENQDVWKFIIKIKNWISDPNRLGLKKNLT